VEGKEILFFGFIQVINMIRRINSDFLWSRISILNDRISIHTSIYLKISKSEVIFFLLKLVDFIVNIVRLGEILSRIRKREDSLIDSISLGVFKLSEIEMTV
jgi:hypothetical protein